MELPAERVGPWVRALYAALDALAPDDAWVSLGAALDHVHALDPAVSGPLLLPAEISARTGMPAYTWLERAAAEATLARASSDRSDPADAELERVRGLDPALGERMFARRALHRHLRRARLLPTTAIEGAVRRLEPTFDVHLRYDRIAPDGRWLRIRIELSTDRGTAPDGVARIADGRVRVDEALQHLLTRHHATPLMALWTQIAEATRARVRELSRGWIGPFWWPGIALPEGVPPALGTGLVLHASREVVGVDVRAPGHGDPWLRPPADEVAPPDHGVFRERRLATTAGLLPAARDWFAAAGMRGTIAPIGQPRPRRL